MNKKVLASFLIAGMVLSTNVSLAASNFQTSPNTPQYMPQYTQSYTPTTYVPPLQGNVTMIPAGTCFQAVTTMELSSATMSLGQGVSVVLGNNFYYGGKLVAPAGSQVNGNVIDVRKGNRAGINGQIKVRFTNIYTPQGQMIPISGMIKTSDGKGTLYAATAKDTTKDYAKDLAIGAAGGALMGTIMGPLSGGQVGKGAALGTAVGAGLGLGKSLIDKGVDVVIPPNSNIDIIIDQPITVSSSPKY